MTLLRVTSISSRHSWGGLHFQPAVKIPLQGRKLTDPPSTGPAPWLPTSPAVAPGPVRHAAPGRQPADVSTSAWPATKGNRAIGRCAGGFAEYALMDGREAMRVPGPLAWEEAAATPLVFVVVYDMLVAQGQLAAGQWLLVTGVSSGVGVAALQTGKVLGARVIGT